VGAASLSPIYGKSGTDERMTCFPIVLFAACVAQSQQTGPKLSEAEVEKQQVERWMQRYADQATGYRFESGDKTPSELKIRSQPVLRWMNPVVAGVTTAHGAVYVWEVDGCPEVIGSVFSYIDAGSPDRGKRVLVDEFHALSDHPLAGWRKSGRDAFWTTDGSGLQLKSVPKAKKPTGSPVTRLTQMREIAHQFSADFEENDVWSELRLLPQPLCRFDSKRPEILDGGVFAFVTGTDPEIMLLIEARKTGKGPEWQYALARFTHLALRVRHAETEVWKAKVFWDKSEKKDPYQAAHTLEIRDKTLP